MTRISRAILMATAALPLAFTVSAVNAQDTAETAEMATATLAGDGMEGTVTFEMTPSGILHIVVDATGVPEGVHGLHIHETGQCDAADGFQSAGGHLAGGREHGVMNENGPHAGDLPNVHVQSDGILQVEYFSTMLTITEDGDGLMLDDDGAAVMLHEGADDNMTDPAGDAGGRIACGVIETTS